MTGLRRWGGYLALVIVFAIACGLLSWWQWSRRAEAVAEVDRIVANYDAAPVPLGDRIDALDAWDEDAEWAPVELRGEYLSDQAVLVRNRPHASGSGYEQLVPLLLDDGSVFVVDRGWLPNGATIDGPDDVPQPPEGEVTVVARLKQGEPTLLGRSAPEGQVATINLPTIAEFVGLPTYTGAYGLLASEDPSAAVLPAPAAKPDEDEGPHLSYALQWIAFGILAFVGLVWAYRREKRIAALPAEEQAAARAPRLRSEDTDEEDAILDRIGRS